MDLLSIVDMITEILIGILIGIIGTFSYNVIARLVKRYKDRKSFYSGRWNSEIYDAEGKVAKEDVLDLIESHGVIKGEMARVRPSYQNDREWIVSGFVRNGHMLLSIIAKDETQASDGSVYVVLKTDKVYEGFYLKKVEDGGIISVPIKLKLNKGYKKK